MALACEGEWIHARDGTGLYDVLSGPKVPPEVGIGNIPSGKYNDSSEENNHEDAPKVKNAAQ